MAEQRFKNNHLKQISFYNKKNDRSTERGTLEISTCTQCHRLCLFVTRIMQGDGVAKFGMMQFFFEIKNKDEMAFKSWNRGLKLNACFLLYYRSNSMNYILLRENTNAIHNNKDTKITTSPLKYFLVALDSFDWLPINNNLKTCILINWKTLKKYFKKRS